MSWETTEVGKGDKQLPQASHPSTAPVASFHTQRSVWWAREMPKLRERVQHREGSADCIQKQLK